MVEVTVEMVEVTVEMVEVTVEMVEVTVEVAVSSELDSVVWFSFVYVTRSVPCRSFIT